MSNPKNLERLARARALLDQYDSSSEGLETALTDLMADMYHLIEQEGLPFEEIRRTAYMHFCAEVGGDD
jgi:hypothetical protein